MSFFGSRPASALNTLLIYAFLFYRQSWASDGVGAIRAFIFIVIGVYTWHVTEYVTHRWILHTLSYGAGVEKLLSVRQRNYIHGFHHSKPSRLDHSHLPMLLFDAIFVPLYMLVRCTFGASVADLMSVGGVGAYVLFELTHYVCHVDISNRTHWLNGWPAVKARVCAIQQFHLEHHRLPTKNYAFTSTFIDAWLGTLFVRKYPTTHEYVWKRLPLPFLMNFLVC